MDSPINKNLILSPDLCNQLASVRKEFQDKEKMADLEDQLMKHLKASKKNLLYICSYCITYFKIEKITDYQNYYQDKERRTVFLTKFEGK